MEKYGKSASFAKTAEWCFCPVGEGGIGQASHYLTVLFDLPLALLPLFVFLIVDIHFLFVELDSSFPLYPPIPAPLFLHFLSRTQLPVPAPVPPAGVPWVSSSGRCSPVCSPFCSSGFGVWLTHGPEPLQMLKRIVTETWTRLSLGHYKHSEAKCHSLKTGNAIPNRKTATPPSTDMKR